MATTPTTVFAAIRGVPVPKLAAVRSNRRRSINPESGHALEKLGHAIDYLTDEYVHEGGSFSRNDSELQAIELLMAVNREIYFACPEVPTLGERIHGWLSGIWH